MSPTSAAFGIGTASFIPNYGLLPGGEPDVHLIRAAVKAGVTYLDTAAAYGDAERALGSIADELRARDVRICTKVAVPEGGTSLTAAIDTSRSRLGVDVLDTVLLHSAPASSVTSSEIASQCLSVMAAGTVRQLGASTYGAEAAAAALAAPWCSAIQFEYSILNPSVWPAARDARRPGQELVVRSVLCKGLLTSTWRQVTELASPLAPTLTALERLAADWNLSLPALAIRFALDTPGIDVVVVGVATDEELADALAARDHIPLTGQQLARLAEFDRSGLDAAHPERWARV